AQALTHARLGARTVTRTYCGKDRIGQARDGDSRIEEAAVAAGVVGCETLEQWEKRYDRGDGEQGFDERRPLGRRLGGPVNNNAGGGGYGHTRPFVPAGEALHLLQRAETSCRCTGRAPGKAKTGSRNNLAARFCYMVLQVRPYVGSRFCSRSKT